jgi:hypothetical protein
MKNKHKHRDAYAFGDDPVIEDGGAVRVPMMLCDSLAGYRPGFVRLSDEQIKARQESRDGMIRSAQKAWCSSSAPIARPIETAAAREEIAQSIARREDSLVDGRRRKPDPDGDEDDDDQDIADAARFAAREAWVMGLRDAWRQPVYQNGTPTNPSPTVRRPM